MTPKLKVTINTEYGAIEVSGDSPEELLEGLSWLTLDFVSDVNERIIEATAGEAEDNLYGIVRLDREGPTIVTHEQLSHYEAIGLILYAMKNHEATSKQIRERLASSGKKVTLAARLHEMRDRGHVFKPDNKGSDYRLTTRGVKWVEDGVIQRLSDED